MPRKPARARPQSNAPLPGQPPLFAEAHRFVLQGDTYALLCFPLPPEGFGGRWTHSERAVADLLLRGLTAAEIARRRKTSARTVANQMASLYRKVGVTSRRALVALFLSRESGALPPQES